MVALFYQAADILSENRRGESGTLSLESWRHYKHLSVPLWASVNHQVPQGNLSELQAKDIYKKMTCNGRIKSSASGDGVEVKAQFNYSTPFRFFFHFRI